MKSTPIQTPPRRSVMVQTTARTSRGDVCKPGKKPLLPPSSRDVAYGARDPKFETEWQAMRNALADVIINWATVEDRLAKLLDALLDKRSDTMGTTIYYATGNTETRIRIIDEVIRYKISAEYNSRIIIKCWSKILLVLNRYKDSRNKIIHGSTVEYKMLDPSRLMKRSYARHIPPNTTTRDVQSMTLLRAGGDKAAREAQRRKGESGQLPGMSPNDIQMAANAFSELAQNIWMFTDGMKLVTGWGHNAREQQPKFLALADHLMIDIRPGDVPNFPAPSEPQQPSGEMVQSGLKVQLEQIFPEPEP